MSLEAVSVPPAMARQATTAARTRDSVITATSSAADMTSNVINQQPQQVDQQHDIEQGTVHPQQELDSGHCPSSHGMANPSHDNAAHLYDAVGAIWLQLFGSHVHVGE